MISTQMLVHIFCNFRKNNLLIFIMIGSQLFELQFPRIKKNRFEKNAFEKKILKTIEI